MQNSFPLWKNFFIVLVLSLGLVYALPNIYGDDPSVQISSTRNSQISDDQRALIETTLSEQGITAKAIEFSDDRILVRLENLDDQIKAADYLKIALGRGFTTALNLAPATPSWLRAIGAEPMYLGLDLRGGVHFLLEVDMDAAIKQAEERYVGDIRGALRAEKIRYASIAKVNDTIQVKLKSEVDAANAKAVLGSEFRNLKIADGKELFVLEARVSIDEKKQIKKFALAQNMTTLRNRVNELGVAEPIIQQQGDSRIVVQLPGVQDTTRAKEILGATAS